MNLTHHQQPTVTVTARSTRGASKHRRDQINLEIQKLRDLLPLSDSMKERLFQLQVMSLACIYIRKQNYLPHIISMATHSSLKPTLRQSEGYRALRGFLLMITKCGKIVYISDNASDYLGHSVAEIMCQGDSVFDLIDYRDHGHLHAELMSGPPSVLDFKFIPDERVFVCRMNLSRTAKRQLQYHKYILMEGRYMHATEYYHAYQSLSAPSPTIQPLFAAYCQMLINPENAETLSIGNTSMFRTLHSMDLKFVHIDQMTVHYLGYKSEELVGKSWYHYLHPDHLLEMAYKHRILSERKDGAVMCLLRMQRIDGTWLWLHTAFSIKENTRNQSSECKQMRCLIHVIYQVLSETEALSLQGNPWIYGIRNEFMTSTLNHVAVVDKYVRGSIGKEHVSQQIIPSSSSLLASLLAIKSEPMPFVNNGLNHFAEPLKDFNNNGESKCPDFNLGNDDEDSELEALPEFCLERNIKGPLPDLSGDLDQFFQEVEHPKTPLNQSQTMIRLPENVKCADDLLSPALPVDALLSPCNRKMPAIEKLVQRDFNAHDSFGNSHGLKDACS